MEDLLETQRKLEAVADPTDPEQKRLLAAIRAETAQLQRLRGDWNKAALHRNWNDPNPTVLEQAPLAIESFRFNRCCAIEHHAIILCPTHMKM